VISDRELACLARDVAEVQPSTVALLRSDRASDGLGGTTDTYTSISTHAARVTPVSTKEAEEQIGGKVRDGMHYSIALPAGTDVRLGDRLDYAGKVLAVEAVMSPRSHEIERRVFAVEAAR
jgi:head-tail adaptor